MITMNANDSRNSTAAQERKGLIIHLIATICVSALVTAINFILCPVFLWFAFPVAGMSIGLAAHYIGVRKLISARPASQI